MPVGTYAPVRLEACVAQIARALSHSFQALDELRVVVAAPDLQLAPVLWSIAEIAQHLGVAFLLQHLLD
eukprot:10635165-Lingulodinium_polyedra.AAC.1